MTKKVKFAIIMLFSAASILSAKNPDVVKISDNGTEFELHGEPYRFVGTNFWYGPILASKGTGGNRERLMTELDSLQAIGIDNLRILAGGDGNRYVSSHIQPNLQTEPGVYDNDLLEGLDFLLDELERRDMRAVIYLNNSWEWSGGYGTYLEWAGAGESPNPKTDGYDNYMKFASQFVTNPAAKGMFADHLTRIVSRVNSVNGRPYAESPAIMSWQIANEPRCFDPANKEIFAEWLIETGRLIKSLDPNHLVSTGSEGLNGCENDIDLWARIHNSDAIDYAIIHIWPYNWGWAKAETLADDVALSVKNTEEYITLHKAKTSKPLVIEEFGFPRDNMAIEPGSPTTARDAYYSYLLEVVNGGKIAGLNFWGWGGLARPAHRSWLPGDDYTGDPAQEDQGLNSVFTTDRSTIDLIRDANRKLGKIK